MFILVDVDASDAINLRYVKDHLALAVPSLIVTVLEEFSDLHTFVPY